MALDAAPMASSTGSFDWPMAIETHINHLKMRGFMRMDPKSVGSWRDPCSTGQNCELMDPSSDLIALWKNNSSKSSSTGQFDWPIQLANGYRDPHLLPTAMIRYMVAVLAKPIFWGSWRDPSLPTLKAGPEKMKSLLPGHRCHTLFSWFRVHGSGPGEIVFLAVLPTAMI